VVGSLSGRTFTFLQRSLVGSEGATMKMVTDYLAQAAEFERMASAENNPTFKEQLLKQAGRLSEIGKGARRKVENTVTTYARAIAACDHAGTTVQSSELYSRPNCRG
jgi:hypothetical protein